MNTTLPLRELHNVHKQLKSGDVILDVRNPDEFSAGHIPGAINIPLPELPQRQAELKTHDTIYIHCKRGGRAKTARDVLANAGYNNLVCVDDAGMDLWIESGFPVTK